MLPLRESLGRAAQVRPRRTAEEALTVVSSYVISIVSQQRRPTSRSWLRSLARGTSEPSMMVTVAAASSASALLESALQHCSALVTQAQRKRLAVGVVCSSGHVPHLAASRCTLTQRCA